MRFLVGFELLLVLLFALESRAEVLEKNAKAFFYDGDRSSLGQQVLGSSCSAFRSLRSEINCNPAFLTLGDDLEEIKYFEDSVFGLNLFFGNDYETLYKNRDLFEKEDKYELAQSLLSEEHAVRFQGATKIWVRMPYMSIWYQPLRWTYFSSVRNSSYPDIAVHAMQESQLGLQYGGHIVGGWQAGAQVRLVDRKFIHEQFKLFDAIAALENYLQVKSQKAVLVEPGVAYRLSGDEWADYWQPVLSLNLTQLGWADQTYDINPLRPTTDLGLSVQPKVTYGEFETGINIRTGSAVDEDNRVRLGLQYRLGVASFLAGYDSSQWSLGVLSAFRNLSAGIMYERRALTDFANERYYDSAASVEFRLML